MANPGKPSSGTLQCMCTRDYKEDADKTLADTYGQADGDQICKYYYDNSLPGGVCTQE